jgi:hypothetical protein
MYSPPDQIEFLRQHPRLDTIWMYWEGPMPAYIALCYQTVSVHNDQVVLLDRTGFDILFVEDRDIPIDSLALNHKSDFIRAYLIKHYGGLYIDADCVVMQNLSPLLDLAQRHGFVGYREPLGYMSCNFMASVPDGAVITEHYQQVCTAVRSKQKLDWLDLASIPMNVAIARHPNSNYQLPGSLIMPMAWTDSDQLALRRSDIEHDKNFKRDAYCYMLSNNTIKSRLQTRLLFYMSETHLLGERYFLSFLFRRALRKEEQSLPEDNPTLGGHENLTQFDEGAFDYLATHFQVKSMVDIGCGPPGMVYYALSKGIRAVGIDGDPSVARDCPVVVEHDYTKGPLYLGEFDLGWSVEFLEHVEEQYIPNFIETFLGCKNVFLTAAVPGQPGHHHVNCQWGDYWIRKFEKVGFSLNREATDGVRRCSNMWSRFTQNTGLVFMRN